MAIKLVENYRKKLNGLRRRWSFGSHSKANGFFCQKCGRSINAGDRIAKKLHQGRCK